MPNTDSTLLVILCILIPFLAVYLERGIGSQFWIDLLLCCFFWIPGIIFAFIVCFGTGGGSGSRGEKR